MLQFEISQPFQFESPVLQHSRKNEPKNTYNRYRSLSELACVGTTLASLPKLGQKERRQNSIRTQKGPLGRETLRALNPFSVPLRHASYYIGSVGVAIAPSIVVTCQSAKLLSMAVGEPLRSHFAFDRRLFASSWKSCNRVSFWFWSRSPFTQKPSSVGSSSFLTRSRLPSLEVNAFPWITLHPSCFQESSALFIATRRQPFRSYWLKQTIREQIRSNKATYSPMHTKRIGQGSDI